MGILSKLFGGGKAEAPAAPATPAAGAASAECVHGNLVPRWDSVDDMGKADKVSHYDCESCSSQFTPAEAEKLRSTGGPADIIGT